MKKSQKRLTTLKKVLNIYTAIGVFFLLLATILFLTPSLPYLWYRINADATGKEAYQISAPTEEDADPDISFADIIETYNNEDSDGSNDEPSEPARPELPPLDESYPDANILIIPKIGVEGQIYEGADALSILENGVWRVPDYGTPEDFTSIILAAHRFGYIYWTQEFRTKNTFYNLPKTGVGDSIEIIWNKRKYKYEIYKAEDSTAISDYDADLILYTCRLFNSPVRVFRYAKRVN